MRSGPSRGDEFGFRGVLTIRKYRGGELCWQSALMRNKVVSGSGGYGRNLVMRHLYGDTTYPLEIDSMSLGDGNAAPADSDTALDNPTVTGVPLTTRALANNVLSIDVFITSENLPNGTYREIGFSCDDRLFSRLLLVPEFTKDEGEDVLFSYELTATG